MTQAAKADPGDGITQAGIASDHAKQALLGSGVQNIYFGERDQAAEPAISLEPPFGLRDDKLPIRGRGVLLDELSNPDPTARVHLVHGLGGCGKTRLALEVAHRAESDGIEAWWVAATEASGFLAVMRSLGRRLGVTDDELRHGDAADVVWQRLLTRAEQWLLVIDNADEPAILAGAGSSVGEGRGWVRRLPTGSAGRVLITSRDGNAETWGGWCRRHRVGMLADDPAATMLADYSGHHPSLGSDEDAKLLAARLGGLPLALKIAGSYLAQSASIPAAFADPGTIATYRDYRAAIDATSPTGQLTPDQALALIGQTWDLTLGRLDARRLPEARRLLRLLACFADAPIPYELLLHPTTLAESNEFAGVTGSRLWQALAALDDCGLIDLTRPAEPEDIAVLRLHPLVRDTSRPSATDLMPILAIALTTRHEIARVMAKQGNHAAAETEFRDILTSKLRVLGPDHPSTKMTARWVAYLAERRATESGTTP